jgi:GTP diphosphokinase / guanosine-3',5'-bis(diphosphate) 3'-diphosphatase
MAILEAPERHQDLIDELIAEVGDYNPDVDGELLARAFRFAAKAHEGQQRRSGEEFIHHPYAVALICAGLQLDDVTIAAALLHDVVEDTDATLEDVTNEFGEEVAQLARPFPEP